MPTRNLAIMFTDIKGFTARTSNETRAELVSLLEEHDRLLRPVFGHYGGNVVKTIGDAFLVWFESPTDAVLCGVTVQEVLRKHNATVDEKQRLQVRVAINVGDCEMRDRDLFGEAVNLASRLEGIAEAGEVWFTEAVFLTMNRHEVPTTEVGERTFKGIPNPVRVYKVIQDPKSDQIRRIGDTVEVERGVPKLDRLTRSGASSPPAAITPTPSAPAPAKRRVMPLVAVAASLVALALAAAVAYPRWHRTRLLDEADRLEARGESRRALDISRDVIRANPDDPVAQDVTFRALEGVTEKMAREESAAKALNWFRSEAAEADFESLGDRLGVIEVRVIATAGKTGQISNYEFRDQMIDAIGRYPKSADVPFEAAHASFHQTGGDIAAFGVLPWYALAVERGHAMTQDIWNACVECFAESDPDECADGRTIARDHQHDEALAWARKAIAEGPTGPAYLNAAAILDDFGGGAPSDPFHVALRTLLDKRDVETTRAAILAGSPDQKKLALVLLHDADSQGWGEERDNARKALEDDLSK